ncbi:hypothetical protein [Microbacterium soli]|uniref:Uncharacterized protein n=1 Tax=Microbacterium soli TaxID=446075 RepID=A0ABP7NIS4_9MICO
MITERDLPIQHRIPAAVKARTPLVYGSSGEVLGIDYRQSPLAAPEVRVPGRIPVHAVLPGDGIRAGREVVTVLRIRGGAAPTASGHLICRTAAGCEIAFEVRPFDRVEVVSVGAFTPAGVL